MDNARTTRREPLYPGPVAGSTRLDLWLPLLRTLSGRIPDWLVYKNAASSLYGAGDVDSVGRRTVWPAVTQEFLVWAGDRGLGPVVLCNHLPPVLFLLAVPDGSETFLEMDVSNGRRWRGSRLFDPADALELAEMDELGFRRLRPGAEGLFKFAFNGVGWSGRPDWSALHAKGILAQLREDPEGVRHAARVSGLAEGPALRAVQAALEGSWDYKAVHALQGASAARSLRHPVAFARLFPHTLRFRVRRPVCEVVRAMVLNQRRIPKDRSAWLATLSDSHQVIRSPHQRP